MTAISLKDNQAIAYKELSDLRSMLRSQNLLFFAIGEKLTVIKEMELYKYMGDGGYDTWSSFLGSGDLSIGQSTANAYMQLYLFWVKDHGYTMDELGDIPYDKLRIAFPKVKTMTSKRELDKTLHKIKELSRSDLRIELGMADEDGNLNNMVVNLHLCSKCQGYKLPKDIIMCSCTLGISLATR